MGNKSIVKLLEGINESKNKEWHKKLYGLGINHIGKVTAKNICAQFKNIHELKKAILNEPSEIIKIDGIGDEIISSLRHWFMDKDNIKLINNLASQGVSFANYYEENKIPKNINPYLNQKQFVITGIMKNFSRNKLIEEIEKNGGSVKNSISSKTDYLISGEKSGSKLDKAKKFGIMILEEEELINLLTYK